ncbi:uncharacterized protein (DUF427 family) [Streptomyces sp. TLI_235]|nr:DUF427 domain-containing protein [Streptomyces sp. TLI_235]PBC76022.1 uncharacterized protein (DUF427 family) [Streptomyces sp. TLI_235]
MTIEGGTESVWDYPRPPRVEKAGRRVTVEFRGLLVADTDEALRVLETSHPPVFYLPSAAVAPGVLVPSWHRSWCEWKGAAVYFDLVVDGTRSENAAWSYPEPAPGYEEIRGHLAFYPGRVDRCTVGGEEVVPQEGGFYGGWITPEIRGPFKGAPGTGGW